MVGQNHEVGLGMLIVVFVGIIVHIVPTVQVTLIREVNRVCSAVDGVRLAELWFFHRGGSIAVLFKRRNSITKVGNLPLVSFLVEHLCKPPAEV